MGLQKGLTTVDSPLILSFQVKQTVRVTVGRIADTGLVSKQAIYAQSKAGKLTFVAGKADPLKLAAEWQQKRDPSQEDRIGPAIERVIGELGLLAQPDPARGRPPAEPSDFDDPTRVGGGYWQSRMRHETAKAKKAELDVAVQEGKLFDAEEVTANWASLGTRVRDEVMAVPSRVVSLLPEEWRRPASVILQEEVRRALSAIAYEFSQHPAGTECVHASGSAAA
jgi:hypothetical protein